MCGPGSCTEAGCAPRSSSRARSAWATRSRSRIDWQRVRDSRVARTLVLYLAAAWLALQVATVVVGAFDGPTWIVRAVFVLLGAGFVVTLLFAWIHDRGPSTERPGWPVLGTVATISLLLAGGAMWWIVRDRGRSLEPATVLAESAAPGIAILPFNVNDPALETWREGMVDLLSTNLDGAGGLRAISSRTVLSRWHREVDEGETPDLVTALGIARATGARYSIVGSVVSGAGAMRVVADVYDLESGESLGQDRAEGAPDSIFGLVDELSIRMLERVLERESPSVNLDLARVTTRSVPALKSFLEGEALSRSSSFRQAIPAYEEAIAADSTFALAYYRLSWAHGWVDALNRSRAAAALASAARYADRLPQRDRDLIAISQAYFANSQSATELAIAATERYPDDPLAWFLLGEVRFHLPFQSLATRDDQDGAFERAVELDPTFTPAYIHALDNAFKYDDAVAADTLIVRYRELAGGTEYDVRYETAYSLFFDDSVDEATADSLLDPLSSQTLHRVLATLAHPAAYTARRQLTDELSTRPDDRLPPPVFPLLIDGRVREGLKAAKAINRDLYLGSLIAFWYAGYPVDLAAEVPPESPSEPPSPGTLVRALLAVEEGRFAEEDSLRNWALGWVDELEARGDSATARDIESGVSLVAARRAMVEGRVEDAFALLDPAYRSGNAPLAIGWTVETLAQLGRLEEAIRYGQVVGPSPWMGTAIAPLYEQVGEIDRAIEAWGWVTLAWQDPDPWLEPKVVEARQEIARLRGLQRS